MRLIDVTGIRFIGPRPHGQVVAHWDGNKLNNRLSNLRYATDVENAADKVRHGTMARGERVGTAKLAASEVIAIREDRRSQRRIAAEFSLSHSTVGRIKRNEGWTHV